MPEGQLLHTLAPDEAVKVPARHFAHGLPWPGSYVPASHLVHSDFEVPLVPELNVPSGQDVHDALPSVSL